MVASAFTQVTVGSPLGTAAPATQLVIAGGPSCLIYNSDPVDIVYLTGSNSYMSIDSTFTSPLLPGASIVVDGSKDVFAVCAPGIQATVFIYPSGLSYTPQTSITSLISSGTLSGASSNITVPGSASAALLSGVPVVQYSSYDLNLFVINPAPSGSPTLSYQVMLQWFDDISSGIPVYEEDWWVYSSITPIPVGGENNPLAGSGPMHGKYFTVKLINGGPDKLNVQFVNIYGSFRTDSFSDWRSNPTVFTPVSPGGLAVYQAPDFGSGFDNTLLGIFERNVPPGTTSFFPIGLYSGPVILRLRTHSATAPGADIVVVSSPNNMLNSGFTGGIANPCVVYNLGQPLNTDVNFSTFFPRSNCSLVIKNSSASVYTFSAQFMAQQGV